MSVNGHRGRPPKPKTITRNDEIGYYVCTLGNGKQFLFDECDIDKVEAYSWFINRYGYPAVKHKGKTILFHRLITDAPKGIDVDHLNGNRFDNRRCNLRLATRSQNMMNRVYAKGKSGHRNVFWQSGCNMWEVCTTQNGEKVFRKFYKNLDEACRVAEEKHKEIFGEYSIYNSREEAIN